MVLKAAVEDSKIARTPCRKINLPEVVTEQVRIPTLGELEAVAALLPANYRRAVPVVAGTGLRLGEVLGLTVDRVGWLRRTITVDRQMQTYPDGRVEHAPVKRAASNRVIPVGDVTLHTLNAQLAEFPSTPDGLIFRTALGGPVRRGRWGAAWGKARAAATIETGQFDEDGLPVLSVVHEELTLHDARHFYASLLIRHGLSVKVVQARLGTPPPSRPSTPTATCGPTTRTAPALRSRPSSGTTSTARRSPADLVEGTWGALRSLLRPCRRMPADVGLGQELPSELRTY